MKVQSLLWRNFDFDNWSNQRLLQALQELDEPPQESVRLLGHILHTKRMWLIRMQDGKTIGYDLWPEIGLPGCQELVDELGSSYAEYLSEIGNAEMQQAIRYHSRKGIPHTTVLSDLLTHVLYHGTIHRGEILQQMRASGNAPPDIDYITYAREDYVEEYEGDYPYPAEDD